MSLQTESQPIYSLDNFDNNAAVNNNSKGRNNSDPERTHILQTAAPNESTRWRSITGSESDHNNKQDQWRNDEENKSTAASPGWRKKVTANFKKDTQSAENVTATNHSYAYYNTQFVTCDEALSSSADSTERSRTDESGLNSVVMKRKNEEHHLERKKFLTPSSDDRSIDGKKIDSSSSAAAIILPTTEFATSYQDRYGLLPPESFNRKVRKSFKSNCDCSLSCFLTFIKSVLPIVSWLPNYKAQYILPDVIAGFTISILHIPQGMGYGILATLKAENGLYVSFFPVLIYFLLGTSRHVSIGTFAVISIMTASAVEGIVNGNGHEHVGANDTVNVTADDYHTTHLEITTSLAVAVGIWQLLLGVLQLGALSVVLSDHLVSGFTTGAAVHVATSQLNDLFGLKMKRFSGPLKLIYMYEDLFEQLKWTNIATLIISAVAIFVLVCTKEQINERFKHKLKMPVPIDLVVVIIATAISYLTDFEGKYGVRIMGVIPTGLPQGSPPRMDLLPKLATDSFAIAIVVFVICLSMGKLFAKKHQYTVRPNQELIALGCANIFSSFFACYPCSASLSRSLLQERAGGRTQMASIVSCIILLLVLLILAPLFETLPRCILATVILVALKGMFLQVKDFIKAWRISKTDALIWLVTVLATVILDISYGLIVGVIFSIFTVIIRTVFPVKTFLGNVPGTDIYLDMNRYSEAKEVKGVKIFHFGSAVYFMNRESFKSYLQTCVPINVGAEEASSIKQNSDLVCHIIIDCSSFVYIDMAGMETLSEVIKEYDAVGITVFLAGCSVTVYDTMSKAKFFDELPKQPSVFMTIDDAVQMCRRS